MPLSTAFPSEAEAYWDDSASEDIAGSDEAKNILWKLKKKLVLVDFCFSVTFVGIPFLQASHSEQNQGKSQRADNSASRAAAAEQRRVCFLICNGKTSAQQFAYDYSAE